MNLKNFNTDSRSGGRIGKDLGQGLEVLNLPLNISPGRV